MQEERSYDCMDSDTITVEDIQKQFPQFNVIQTAHLTEVFETVILETLWVFPHDFVPLDLVIFRLISKGYGHIPISFTMWIIKKVILERKKGE